MNIRFYLFEHANGMHKMPIEVQRMPTGSFYFRFYLLEHAKGEYQCDSSACYMDYFRCIIGNEHSLIFIENRLWRVPM